MFALLCCSQITELCHEIDDRDDALAKAREAAHKAQLQKYQVNIVFCYKAIKKEKIKVIILWMFKLICSLE